MDCFESDWGASSDAREDCTHGCTTTWMAWTIALGIQQNQSSIVSLNSGCLILAQLQQFSGISADSGVLQRSFVDQRDVGDGAVVDESRIREQQAIPHQVGRSVIDGPASDSDIPAQTTSAQYHSEGRKEEAPFEEVEGIESPFSKELAISVSVSRYEAELRQILQVQSAARFSPVPRHPGILHVQ